MKKEDFGEPEEILRDKFMKTSQPIFDYIMKNNLGQILKPKINDLMT